MERILCLLTGYVFGLFQTGYLYGKMHHIDIRQYGSGNSGTTNALRVMGKKAGLPVFMGDFLKDGFCLPAGAAGDEGRPRAWTCTSFMRAWGWSLATISPSDPHFKGGKGIASMAGILVSMDWRVTLVCASLFLGAVILTRYVSLGSILVVTAFFIQMVFFGLRGTMQWQRETGWNSLRWPESLWSWPSGATEPISGGF